MRQFVKFFLVGVFNTGVGYAVIFSCMYLLGLSAVLSNILGYLFGLSISYFLNRNFTFRSTSQPKTEIPKFLFVFFVAYFANLGVLLLLLSHTEIHEALSQIIAGVVYITTSFSMNKNFVFRQSQ